MSGILRDVAHCKFKGRQIEIRRDEIHGRYFIEVNGVVTQKNLTASELAGWFCNLINEN